MKRIHTFCLFVILSVTSFAQSNLWNSFLVLDPSPTSFLSEWTRNPESSVFTVNYLGTAAVDYRLQLIIRDSENRELVRARSGVESFPSGPSSKVYAGTKVIDWRDVKFDNTTYQQVLRTNRFPEGTFDVIIRVLGTNDQVLTESNGIINIIYPDAPVLFAPSNGQSYNQQFPIFQWAPVNLPLTINSSYNLLIVEKLPGQSISQALAANPPHHQVSLPTGTFYQYPQDGLPLQKGKEYAWRVRVTDDLGNPLTANNGSSEQWSFIYDYGEQDPSLLPFLAVNIIRNVAWFDSYDLLQVAQDAESFVMNGVTDLKLRLADGQQRIINVTVENLTFAKGAYTNFNFTAGRIYANLQQDVLPASLVSEYFKPEYLEFTSFNGLTIRGRIELPGVITPVNPQGELTVSPTGALTGMLEFDGSSALPVYTFGNETARMNLTRLSLTYPNAALRLSGELVVFNNYTLCEINGVTISSSGDISGSINCNTPIDVIPIPSASEYITLKLKSVSGNFSFSPLSGASNIDLNLNSDFGVSLPGFLNYKVNLGASIGNGMFGVQNFTNLNTGSLNSVDLGFMKIDLSGLQFNRLSYQNGQWDFGIDFNMAYNFPDLGGFTVGPFEGLSLTPSGFNLPSFSGLSLGAGTGGGSRFFDFQGIRLEFLNGSSSGSSISLTDIVNNLLGGNFNLNFGVKISLPNLPSGTPIELMNPDINLNANLDFNGLSLTIPPVTFTGLEMPLAGGVKFNVKEFGGRIEAPFSAGGFTFNPELKLKGGLKLPDGAFGCEGTTPELDLMTSYVLLSGNGNISGEVQNIVPSCSLKVGNFGLNITNSSLIFSAGTDGQKVILGGDATLSLREFAGGEVSANVDFVYDVLGNSLTEFTGEVSTPFTLNYPRTNPVMSFNIGSMLITKDGLKINGRSNANIGAGANVGVTFDEVKFNYTGGGIQGGRIIFDNGFGIAADLQGSTPSLSFTAKGDGPPAATGVLINMPDTLEITKDGLGIAGTGIAFLRYEGRTYNLGAGFINGFKIGLENKEITAGQVNLILNSSLVASLNRSGFNVYALNLITTVLPARLPMPRSDIAFIQLRDQNDSLLVNFEEAGDNVRIKTKPDVPVLASFPGLKFNGTVAPELMIEFDITVDKTDHSLKLGRIEVEVPADKLGTFDLTGVGIPYKLKRFEYKVEEGITKLLFGGVLTLFKTELGNENLVLQVDQTGYLKSQFNFNTDKKIFLVEGSDRLALEVTKVAGTVNTDLVNYSVPDFDIAVTGGLRLKLTETKSHAVSTTLRVSNNTFELVDFNFTLPDSLPKLALGKLNLDLLDIKLPNISFSPEFGWDFDLDLDVNLDFPSLNFSIPDLPGFEIGKLGLNFPQVSIPQLTVPEFNLKGFSFLPLSFRMPKFSLNIFDPFNISWDDLAFSFDFELKFPNIPKIPQQLRNLRVYVVDAGFNGSNLTGRIADAAYLGDDFFIPFGTTGGGYLIKGVGGSLSEGTDGDQIVDLKVKGSIVLPERLRCANSNGQTTLGENMLSINSLGMISGEVRGFVPQCDIKLGKAVLNVTTSDLFFSNVPDTQYVRLDLAANLSLPVSEGNTARGSGNISLDLTNGKILDGAIGINQSFTISLPKQKPVFNFTVNQASVGREGFAFSGNSKLTFDGGASVDVSFQNFLLSLEDLAYQGGSVSVNSSFGLLVTLENGAMSWKAVKGDHVLSQNNTLLLTMPSGLTISNNKIALTGESAVSFIYNNQTYNALRLVFEDNCEISFVDFKVRQGRMSFYRGTERLAFLDATGFVLDNIAAIVELPAKMPLGSLNRAYLVLRDQNGNPLVKTENTQNGLRIGNREGSMVKLVVPALKYTSAEAPEFNIALDIVVNQTTFEPVSGSILVEGANAPLLDLSSKGIPLKITRLGFTAGAGGYELTASGGVVLPQALGGLEAVIERIVINDDGLSGTVTMGTYSERFNPNAGYLKALKLGTFAEFKLQGLNFTFGNEKSFKLSGDIKSKFFRSGSDTSAIHFTALFQNNSFNFGFDLSHIPGAEIPVSVARFRPQSIGTQPSISISFSQNDFELLLSGTLTAPSISPEFSVSFQGLRLSKDAVEVPEVDITLPSAYQRFKLFKADFELKNIGSNKAVAFSYENDVFYMSMSGAITFMGKTSEFFGFKVGTNGSISMSGANLLTETTWVVENRLALTKLAVTSENNVYYLDVNGLVRLPQPADSSDQLFRMKVGTDGSVTGGAKVVVFNEEPGLGNNDRSEFNLWVGKFDPEYLAINIDLDNYRNSNIEVVSSFYFKNDPQKYIRFGSRSGGATTAGLTIGFNGDYTWGPVNANGLTDIEFGNLRLNITNYTTESLENGKFKLTVSGTAAANFNSVAGSLNFSDLGIHSDGTLENVNGMITGGSLDVKNVISLSISSFAMSFEETELTLREGSFVTESSGGTVDSSVVLVKNFIRFGGSVTIPNFGGGGVDQFLLYTRKSDNGVNLLIKNANFSMKSGMVQFGVDISYRTEGDNFFLMFAGNGKLNRIYDIAVIGKLSKEENTTRAGIFMAALEMPPIVIGPGILLTGVGGGFFLNPTQQDLNIVRAKCGLDNDTKGRVVASPGSFAALVYGQFAFGANSVINARVLLTLSENNFNLAGKAVLLNQTNSINGKFELTVGFSEAYALGSLTVDLNMRSLITGQATLDFYIYNQNTWGIVGRANYNIINAINGSGDFYVGDQGFYASARMSQGFNVWIVKVEGGLDLKVWYRPNIDWGAYFEVYIDASVFGGIASAKGTARGILRETNQEFTLYGGASLSINLLFINWDGDIWLRISQRGYSAGFGRDGAMDALIENARNIGTAMTATAANAKTQLANTPVPSLGITPQVIALAIDSMYYRLTQVRSFDQSVASSWAAWFQDMINNENNRVNNNISVYMADYLNSLRDALLGTGGNVGELKSAILQAIPLIDQKMSEFNNSVVTLSNSLTNVSNNIVLPGEPVQLNISNPLETAVFSAPQVTYSNSGGQIVANVVSGPSFSLNEGSINNNRQKIDQFFSSSVEYENLMKSNLASIETMIGGFDAIFGGADNQFLSLGLKFNELRSSVENLYKLMGEYYYADRRYLINTAGFNLIFNISSEFAFRRHDIERIEETGTSGSTIREVPFSDEQLALRAYSRWLRIKNLAGDTTTAGFHAEFQALTSAQKLESARNLLRQLYNTIPREALQLTADRALPRMVAIKGAFESRISSVYNTHSLYTNLLGKVFEKRHSMAQNLFEVLDRYVYWKATQHDTVKNAAPSLESLTSKKAAVVADLTLPVISSLGQSNTNMRYVNSQSYNWASASGNIIEYAIQRTEGDTPANDSSYVSVGNITSMKFFNFPDRDSVQTTTPVTLHLRARNKAGLVSYRSVTSQVETGPVSISGDGGTNTNTSPPDYSPPTTPVVSLLQVIEVGQGSSLYYISPNTGSLKARWSSSDPQSGVTGYAYSIGTSPGTTNVRDWQDVGTISDMLIQGLELQDKGNYYLNVVARNRDGIASETGSSSRLFIDATRPPAPVIMPAQPVAFNASQSVPSGSGFGNIFQPLPAPGQVSVSGNASVNFSWSVENDSGIVGYQYRIFTLPDSTAVTDGWISAGKVNSATHTFPTSKQFKSLRIELRSVKYTGVIGDATASNQYKLADNTKPGTPELRYFYGVPDGATGTMPKSNLNLYFSRQAADAESGINRYQIAVTDQPAYLYQGFNWVDHSSFVNIPADGIVRIPPSLLENYDLGSAIYIHLRAVNNAGLAGDIVSSERFHLLDDTPPVIEEMTVVNAARQITGSDTTFISGTDEYTVRFRVSDPQSGINMVSLQENGNGGATVHSLNGVEYTVSGNRTGFYPFSEPVDLTLHVENRTGVSQTKTLRLNFDRTQPAAPTASSPGIDASQSQQGATYGEAPDPLPEIINDQPVTVNQINVNWSVGDTSGITGYEYRVITRDAGLELTQGWVYTAQRSVTVPLNGSYQLNDLVCEVRSLRFTGARSSTTVISDFTVQDNSKPDAPVVRFTSNGQTLFFEKLSSDPQSGVKYYQVSVGNSAGDTGLLDWTTSATFVNIPSNRLVNIPTELQMLLAGGKYLNLRGVNGGNVAGDFISVGPFSVQAAPPPPVVEYFLGGGLNGDLGRFWFRTERYTHNSDISKYQYSVGTSWGDTSVSGWKDITLPDNFPSMSVAKAPLSLYDNMIPGNNYAVNVRSVGQGGAASAPVAVRQTNAAWNEFTVAMELPYPLYTTLIPFGNDYRLLLTGEPNPYLVKYYYCIGTAPGQANIRGWTEVPATDQETTLLSAGELQMWRGRGFYVGVYAVSVVGSHRGPVSWSEFVW